MASHHARASNRVIRIALIWIPLAFGCFSGGNAAPVGVFYLRQAHVRDEVEGFATSGIRDSDLASLRRAIEDLVASFPRRYPRGNEFLKRLSHLEIRVAAATAGQSDAIGEELETLRREALIANPLLSEQPILFVTRPQYRSHYHAIDTLFHTGELNWDRQRQHADLFGPGGSLKTIDLKTGRVATLYDAPDGIVRDPDVSHDGKRVVFALRRERGEDYHICEMDVDGSNLARLTSLPGVCDFDPVYLPDGSIVFSSTREPKYNMCSRDHGANLFRMDADGANIHRITRNTLFDNHAEVMPDGRILYARWEYVDRNFGDAHSVWTVNPDGTGQAIYWGNNTAVPGAVFNQHVIPGTHRMLCILGPHHDRLWGALAIIDPSLGLDGPEPILRTWPADKKNQARTGGPFACDALSGFWPKYEDPWPLSEKYFLCARTVRDGDEQTGLYLVDVFGNELLLHTESPGCYDPMPVKPRTRPPVLPTRRKFDGSTGYVYVQNVHHGTHMKGVEPGAIKFLRVVESGTKKNWSGGSWGGQGYQAPGMNWHDFENKRILGEIPVEPDGSAYFEVPADRFIYFQALDHNKMMVQSMRSGTVVQAGETQSCTGCHESRLEAPRAAGPGTLAMRRPPTKLSGWFGPPRDFSYAREVQPVLDKHCVRCHDFGKEAGEKLILSGDRNPFFNASYIDLWIWQRQMIKCVGGGPAEVQQAYSWGSHPSKLSQVLRTKSEHHEDLKLSSEDLQRINTWLDLNAPYYPAYECAYPDSPSGRSPLDRAQLQRLGQLTGLDFNGRLKNHGRTERAQIAFERPALSPCLQRIKDKKSADYEEAVAIIEAGAATLRTKPRCDMDGFVPCPTDRQRLKRFDRLTHIEGQFRSAIREGRKVYDKQVADAPKLLAP